VLPAYPQPLPPRPRRGWLGEVLSTLLVLAAVLTAGGGATAVATPRGGGGTAGVAFVDGLRPAVRGTALRALLDRRAKAVLGHNRQAFLADVDPADDGFVRQQQVEFDNLTKLSLADFDYQFEEGVHYDTVIPAALRGRYHSVVLAAAVDVRYRIDGMDADPVAAPWAPIFGLSGGRWFLAGVIHDPKLPTGANGQAWETGPITVARSQRVVLVLSVSDAGRAADMLRMAEAGLDHVAAVRRGGWAGKVLITAVQDPKLFTTYFADSPDSIDNFAAIAVPYYAQVPDWHPDAKYAATRVVFNPHEFSADPTELAHDLTHEFAHAAMGPVTADNTPLWLVEGFAEYVAYKSEQVSGLFVKRTIQGYPTGTEPPSVDFYGDGRNYVLGWLACRMIAQKYGEAKLVALYETFQPGRNVGDEIKRVLGVDQSTLNGLYVSYVDRARTGSLP
jgi:hypothetical protein